ncbi:MAG: uracil-DNA glycosylase [Pseudomonadota bacterium]
MSASLTVANPPLNCNLCPRLSAFREDNQAQHPDWFNAPAPSFGPKNAQLLIVGLAPGLQGANRTGRPFTGDYAGDLLYATLDTFGFSSGVYGARPDDGLELVDTMITNAVRCVPPKNKPVGAEIAACRPFLRNQIDALANLRAILCLGRIAHDSTLTALGVRKKDAPFGHGAAHHFPAFPFTLFDSYHCSRYNTNTGRLTKAMFHAVFAKIKSRLS